MKPFVYIASAYTKGDPCVNARFQLKMFDELLSEKVVTPFAPLISHFQHSVFPRPYMDWVEYDLEIIPRFDCCLRLTSTDERMPEYSVAESSGADTEVALFRKLNKPVFLSKQDLYAWAKGL